MVSKGIKRIRFNLHIVILSEAMIFFVTTLKFSSFANFGCGNSGHKWI